MLKHEYFEIIVSLSTCTLVFISYFFISKSEFLYKFCQKLILLSIGNREDVSSKEKIQILWVVIQRLTGALFLGIIPVITCLFLLSKNFSFYGISMQNLIPTFYWILGISALIIPMNMIFSRKPGNMRIYPKFRVKDWTIRILLLNAGSWAAYLLAYEFLLRGFLLFSCERILGYWLAIMISTTIYAFVHIPKGAKETLCAIPFGIFLCIITFETGTIWPAFILHLILALSNDFIAVYANSKMQFKIR